MLLRGNAALREKLAEELARGDVHLEVPRREAHPTKRIHRRADHLDFRENRLLADDVDVPLVVLALAALRHALVAEALRNRRPLERERKLLLPLRDHARQSRRHLSPERQVTFGLVVEVVDLLADFLARLAREKLVALHHARVVRLEPGRLARCAKRIKHLIAPHHVLGIEIPHAARRLETQLLCHNECSIAKIRAVRRTGGAWTPPTGRARRGTRSSCREPGPADRPCRAAPC